MKADFYVDERRIEVRRNVTCCPRKGEIVTFDGENFFEVTEVINDFNIGHFILQLKERPDYSILCRDELLPADVYNDEELEEDGTCDGDIDDFDNDYDEE